MTNNTEIFRSNYAPGPYTVELFKDGCDEYLRVIEMTHQVELASIFVSWDITDKKMQRLLEQAWLFAAAPQLLDALELLLVTDKQLHEKYDAAVSKSIVAIAKARGKSILDAASHLQKATKHFSAKRVRRRRPRLITERGKEVQEQSVTSV